MQDISTYQSSFHVKLVFANFCYLVVYGQLVILSDRELHPMTSNPEFTPTYTKQGHFRKLSEVLVKIVDRGWWLTVIVVICTPDEGFPAVLMGAVTGYKLDKLGWIKIERQNTFFQYLCFIFTMFPVSTQRWKWHLYFSI